MIVSFALTVSPLLSGRKTVTRRWWKASHAAHFRPGTTHEAATRSLRNGGHRVGRFVVRTCNPEPLDVLLASPLYARLELKREGGLWTDVDEFIALLRKNKPAGYRGDAPYRMSFQMIDVYSIN